MRIKPPNVDYEPVLCPTCLFDSRATYTWLDAQTLNLICPFHDAVLTAQSLEAISGSDD